MAEGPHPAPGHTAPAPTVRAGGTEGPCSVTTIRATGRRRGQHELTPSRAARSPPYRQGDRGSGGAAGEKRARAFSADQPPEAEEQELEPGRISAPCWPGVPRPPAPIPHPWAFPPRPQPHEATSSSPCDTPKAALLGTVEPAGTLEPGEPGGWRGLGCRGGDGGQSGQSGGPNPRSWASRAEPLCHLEAGSVAPTLLPACGPHALPTLHLPYPTPMPFGFIPRPAPGVPGGVGPVPGGHPVCVSTSPGPPSRGQVWGQQAHRGTERGSQGETEGPEEP